MQPRLQLGFPTLGNRWQPSGTSGHLPSGASAHLETAPGRRGKQLQPEPVVGPHLKSIVWWRAARAQLRLQDRVGMALVVVGSAPARFFR